MRCHFHPWQRQRVMTRAVQQDNWPSRVSSLLLSCDSSRAIINSTALRISRTRSSFAPFTLSTLRSFTPTLNTLHYLPPTVKKRVTNLAQNIPPNGSISLQGRIPRRFFFKFSGIVASFGTQSTTKIWSESFEVFNLYLYFANTVGFPKYQNANFHHISQT